MPTTDPTRDLDDLARRAAEVFDRQVRPALQPADDGKYVAIDVNTGEYEIDANDYAAVMRLRSRRPEAEIWLERAGYPTAIKMRLGRCSGAR